MQELRDLAARHTRISNAIIGRMRLKPVLAGTQREEATNSSGCKRINSLQQPKDIVIVNDVHAYQLFGDEIVAAPENMSPELEGEHVSWTCKIQHHTEQNRFLRVTRVPILDHGHPRGMQPVQGEARVRPNNAFQIQWFD